MRSSLIAKVKAAIHRGTSAIILDREGHEAAIHGGISAIILDREDHKAAIPGRAASFGDHPGSQESRSGHPWPHC